MRTGSWGASLSLGPKGPAPPTALPLPYCVLGPSSEEHGERVVWAEYGVVDKDEMRD